jgi:alcohol dehydrogenase class IV
MAWDSVHLFECPTRVQYGAGASGAAGETLRGLGVSRALVVSDPGVEGAGLVDRVCEHATGAGIDVALYAKTEPNPTGTNVHEAADLYREAGCDGILGIGGGSSMDAAKAAGVVVANGGSIFDYAGRDNVPNDIPPLVCVPTTCGTGSEVTFVSVISDPARHFKAVLASRRIAARAALVDPDLVVSAPASVIAATGVDALAHATESFVNTGSDPLLDALNIRAIRMIGANLRRAVHERDPDAIAQMSLASTMTGIAFAMNANAVVHAASTPVTAHYGVPHGVANAIFLADGLDFLRPACEEKLPEIAEALGEDVAGLPVADAALRAVDAIRALAKDVGMPATLREWGLDPADLDIPTLIEDAMKSRNVTTNPRPVGPPELEALYRTVAG